MKRLRQIARDWDLFFFRRERPTAIALYRIVFGLLVLAKLLLLWPDRLAWYGERGVFPWAACRALASPPRLNLFAFWPRGNAAVDLYFLLALGCAGLLTLGLFTRASSVAVYVLLVSLDHRNLFILNGGDAMLRVSAFFLIFAPAGGAISLDRLRRILNGREGPAPPRRSPWAQRLLQIQLSFAYLAAFYAKAQGTLWIGGLALYYVLRLQEFRRFPVPSIHSLAVIRGLTWSVMAIEFAAGALVWIKEMRYFVLALAALMHFGIDYAMNIPLFEWVMMALFLTFVPAWDLRRAAAWARARIARRLSKPARVVFDAGSPGRRRIAVALQSLDLLGRFQFFAEEGCAPGAGAWSIFLPSGAALTGVAALRRLAGGIPLLWPIGCALRIPGSARLGRRLLRTFAEA
jgi:hypothetical protein